MTRFTITNLRAIVDEANEAYPLSEPNGYGDNHRFTIYRAYGRSRVDMLTPGSTGHTPVSDFGTAREAADSFRWFMTNNASFN